MVSGEPAPSVRWGRNKGTVDDPVKYNSRYDKRAQEHILEVRNSNKNLSIYLEMKIYLKKDETLC